MPEMPGVSAIALGIPGFQLLFLVLVFADLADQTTGKSQSNYYLGLN
jgi:hypothetical protein